MAVLKINRGTTYTINVQYQRNGVNTSLVGATVRFTVKPTEYTDTYTDADATIQKNITTGDATGAVAIVLLPADTAQVEPGKYYYDIKVKDVSGNVYKLDEGQLKLDGSPTNRLT